MENFPQTKCVCLAVSICTVWFEENHGIKNNQKISMPVYSKSLVSPSIVVSSDA
jgi:hypothetical protein